MMLRGILIVALLATLSQHAGSQTRPKPSTVSREVTSEEYAVYSAFIEHEFVGRRFELLNIERIGTVYVDEQTMRYSPQEWLADVRSKWEDGLKKLTPDISVDEFLTKNGQRAAIGNHVHTSAKLVIVARTQREKVIHDLGKGLFQRKHPDSPGLLTLSRVTFTADGKHALMEYQLNCGPLCGEGASVSLVRENNQWRVVGFANSYVS